MRSAHAERTRLSGCPGRDDGDGPGQLTGEVCVTQATTLVEGGVEGDEVDAAVTPQAARDVADRDDECAGICEHPGRWGADLAVALDGDAQAFEGESCVVGGGGEHRDQAAAGRRRAPLGAAEGEGLARHAGGQCVAGVDRQGVHHPGHHRLVGAHVGGGDVTVGAEDGHELGDVAAGEALELGAAECGWVDGDAALGTAVGDVQQRRFPGHEGRQCRDVAQVGRCVESDPALGGAPGDVVLHPPAGEDLHGGSNLKRTWGCSLGHRWEATVVSRARAGTGCPYCSNSRLLVGFNDLATRFPDLAAEAHGWDPAAVVAGTDGLEWRCRTGHIWTATVTARLAGSGCRVCANQELLAGYNDLATLDPDLAAQADGWDPSAVAPTSKQKLPWIGPCGHRWRAVVGNRYSNSAGCPTCNFGGGFNPGRRGLLYVVESDGYDFYKFGITNVEARVDRIATHRRRHGAVLRWSWEDAGTVVARAEERVRRWKRDEGLPHGLSSGEPGYTETVPRSLVSLEELVAVCIHAVGLVRLG